MIASIRARRRRSRTRRAGRRAPCAGNARLWLSCGGVARLGGVSQGIRAMVPEHLAAFAHDLFVGGQERSLEPEVEAGDEIEIVLCGRERSGERLDAGRQAAVGVGDALLPEPPRSSRLCKMSFQRWRPISCLVSHDTMPGTQPPSARAGQSSSLWRRLSALRFCWDRNGRERRSTWGERCLGLRPRGRRSRRSRRRAARVRRRRERRAERWRADCEPGRNRGRRAPSAPCRPRRRRRT